MKTRSLIIGTIATVGTMLALALSAQAAEQRIATIAPPQPGYGLPKFGFESRNIYGVGEQVTYVRQHGLAARLGIEPGDLLLRLNGTELTYHGSWAQSLSQAMAYGGSVQLAIRDVRTGHVVFREVFLGDHGPVTPKVHVVDYHQHQPKCHRGDNWRPGNPVGPITPKSRANGNFGPNGPITQKSVQGGQPQTRQNNIQGQLSNLVRSAFGSRE